MFFSENLRAIEMKTKNKNEQARTSRPINT